VDYDPWSQCSRCGARLLSEPERPVKQIQTGPLLPGYRPQYHLCSDCLETHRGAIRSDLWGWLVPEPGGHPS
jgi:hypothetical protein